MRITIVTLFFISTSTFLSAQTPECHFNHGFNFGGWFQGESPKQIPNWYTKRDFQNLVTLGCDVIRLPINLFGMSADTPDYTIDPVLFKWLERPVRWAEELGMHIILDNHRTDPSDPADTAKLISVWQQMADYFKNRSNLIYYEITNEPYGISDNEWGEMQRKTIEAIRAIDNDHTIIVSPAGMGSYYHLEKLPHYKDDNLIYTFHFYDPMLFTHQGADWTEPSMADITGVPYPYDASRMPEKPSSVEGTWVGDLFDWYPNDGNKASIQSKIDIAIQFRDLRQVPIYCGEFGALQGGSTAEDRTRWYTDVSGIFSQGQVPWTMWGYAGGFGIFKEGMSYIFPDNLDVPTVEALGMNVPSMEPTPITPDTAAFVLYDDLLSPEVNDVSYGGGTTNYWTDIDPKIDDFCISWKDAERYGNLSWQFSPTRKFSFLFERRYTLRFWMKANAPDLRIDARFVDTDLQDGADHPWRMSKTIDNSVAKLDGTWGLVEIPLKEMVDSGSWHNDQWFDPQGLFDWSKIDKFEFVAEHHTLQGIEIYFDQIEIVKVFKPEIILVKPNGGEKWEVNSQQNITWTSQDVDQVKIEYSANTGSNWVTIDSLVNAINAAIEWTVPSDVSDNCVVRISDQNDSNVMDKSDNVFGIVHPSSVQNEITIPNELELCDNYPNPFNSQTTIKIGLPKNGNIKVTLFNNLGQRISKIFDGYLNAGYHKIVFQSDLGNNDLTSGIYFYQIEFTNHQLVKKMVLIR